MSDAELAAQELAEQKAENPAMHMSDRELAEETLRLTQDTNAKITEAVNLIQSVSAEVGPVIESITQSPAMKMLGFGPKKFGK